MGTTICVGMLFLVFMAISASTFVAGLRQMSKSKAVLNWPTTTGRVLESRVLHSSGTQFGSRGGRMYEAYVKYAYEALGQTFESSRVAFGSVSTSWSSPAERTVAQYPAGSQVQVFFDPDHPSEAVLQQESSAGIYLMPGVGCFLFALSSAGLVIFLLIRILMMSAEPAGGG